MWSTCRTSEVFSHADVTIVCQCQIRQDFCETTHAVSKIINTVQMRVVPHAAEFMSLRCLKHNQTHPEDTPQLEHWRDHVRLSTVCRNPRSAHAQAWQQQFECCLLFASLVSSSPRCSNIHLRLPKFIASSKITAGWVSSSDEYHLINQITHNKWEKCFGIMLMGHVSTISRIQNSFEICGG